MVSKYLFEKFYNLNKQTEQELLDLAIILCKVRINICKDENPTIAHFCGPYIHEDEKALAALSNYQSTNLSEHLLSKIIYRYISPRRNFDKFIARLPELEEKTEELYNLIAIKTQNLELAKLAKDLAVQSHKRKAAMRTMLGELKNHKSEIIKEQNKIRLLTIIQPGLAGLMDGSVSTLGPIFAAAFATNNTRDTFLVGLSASIGAGISMGFTEAIHDDGKLSGRGSPLKRGLANGIMTTLGGLGHTLPYLIRDFKMATIIAIIVVFIELWSIVWIQNKYMQIPFSRATIQVVIGGLLVFFTGVFLGLA